ncbi:class I SAM-dependent methyltransferase [Lujinxingia vulgaris]|uniref:Class I SAM-dependent methyltransferase n=1 Tax=Lujinxingia vulgaris TaxID=2600176 RepID=A0A5C6XFS3_9DELT|nr:class I SAM-dependent methyltransferase [Lujinxingia vulgaris]TXD36229.1 class I SAM-dependent methyltransferase [Lujinxingia vulgaris]
MSSAESERFWDRRARKYAKGTIGDVEGYERTLERTREHLRPGGSVLELGCGSGSTALLLAEHAGRYLATDISAEMIAIANEKLAETPVSGLAFQKATAESLAGEEARFDVVLGFNYLHLAGDLGETLAHVRELLVPGGLFISKTPCVLDMNPLVRLAVRVMQALGKAPGVSRVSERGLKQAMGEAGFEVVVCERHASKGRDDRPFIVAKRV